jgi:hypothetical protein
LETICGLKPRPEGADSKGGGLNISGPDPSEKEGTLDDEFEM